VKQRQHGSRSHSHRAGSCSGVALHLSPSSRDVVIDLYASIVAAVLASHAASRDQTSLLWHILQLHYI
jgi:hypothetical protein